MPWVLRRLQSDLLRAVGSVGKTRKDCNLKLGVSRPHAWVYRTAAELFAQHRSVHEEEPEKLTGSRIDIDYAEEICARIHFPV